MLQAPDLRRHRSQSIVSYTSSTSVASSTRAQHPASLYSNDHDIDIDGDDNDNDDAISFDNTVESTQVQRGNSPDSDLFQDDYGLPIFALTLFDFESDDADHMSFRKNEIIEIFAMEPSGWWAARRNPADALGWVPAEFVDVLTSDIFRRLQALAPEVREHEYNVLVDGMAVMNFQDNDDGQDLDDAMSIIADNQSFVSADYGDLTSPRGFPTDVTPFTSRFPPPAPFLDQSLLPPTAPWRPSQQPRLHPLPQTPRTPLAPRVPAPAPHRQATLPYRSLPLTPAQAATAPRSLHNNNNTSNSNSNSHHHHPPPLKVTIAPLAINKNKPTPPTPSSASTPPPLTSVPASGTSSSSLTSLASSFLPRSRSVGSPALSSISPASSYSKGLRYRAGLGSSSSSSISPSAHIPRPARVLNDSYVTSPNENAADYDKELEYLEEADDIVDASTEATTRRKFGGRNGSVSAGGTPDKIRRLTGDDKAQAFANAKREQALLPWYLKPVHGEPEVKLEHDGNIRAGTLAALVERLTIEPLRAEHEGRFRNTFLMTFHAFSTAEEVFDLLVERYQMDAPTDLVGNQFEEWKTKKAMPTRSRVLFTLKIWVEQHGLVQDDPQMIPRLKEFLKLVITPLPHAQTAQGILLELQRRRELSPPLRSAPLPNSSFPPPRKSSKRGRSELLKLDHTELARQLTLYEARLYLVVRPHECMTWANAPRGEGVKNLKAFVSTNDKLAAWVKMSVLGNDALGRRADTIEMWIRVAEKCRALNNFASMSAIVAALTSQVISRLQLTWAHVHRASHMDPLVRLVQPVDNFGALRSALGSVDGPCLPYIGIYLSDMVRVSEPIDSYVTVPITDMDLTAMLVGAAGGRGSGQGQQARELKLINFFKYQRMADVMENILKHQRRVASFNIAEVPSTMQFVEAQLALAAAKDEGGFWMRSQEVQHAELAHADIRKGLEAAGF